MKKSPKNQSRAATPDALAKAAGKSGGALTERDLNKVTGGALALKIDPVDGESLTKNHKKEIE